MGSKELAGAMLHPRHPERVCWGCDHYCPAEKLGCANGSIRTPHPSELFGDDWLEWEQREHELPRPARRNTGRRSEQAS